MLKNLSLQMLPGIEAELRRAVAQCDGEGLAELHEMLAYHMGWEGEGAGSAATGKRIRPLLVLLSAAAVCNEWSPALPAAAAVELLHNFSLIHDDIQDNSPLRRGRPTVWKIWGIPQAINAGDTMLTLAHLALLRLRETATPAVALRAADLLQRTCLHLTQGQYLDIAYENRGDLSLDSYWPMVSGKTAALLSACTALGAMAGGAGEERLAAFSEFGRALGLAFQAQDDILGLWGDAALTGKSAESDLLAGKKSLPILFGLRQDGAFARRWRQGPIQASEVQQLTAQLEQEGARAFAQDAADRLTSQALEALQRADALPPAGAALRELALQLLNRKG